MSRWPLRELAQSSWPIVDPRDQQADWMGPEKIPLKTPGLTDKKHNQAESGLKRGRRSQRAMHQLAVSNWLGEHCPDRKPAKQLAGAAGASSWRAFRTDRPSACLSTFGMKARQTCHRSDPLRNNLSINIRHTLSRPINIKIPQRNSI